MDFFRIPFENKEILYRPKLHYAVLANHFAADLAEEVCNHPDRMDVLIQNEVIHYLKETGFFQEDPIIESQSSFSLDFSPTAAALLMTNRCNLRCIYCYANGGTENDLDMTFSTAKKAIDLVSNNAIKKNRSFFHVTFHGGGEPTLNWDVLVEAATYAKQKSIPVKTCLVSNGIWSQKQFEWISQQIDEITISMDGDQQTQDYQRPFSNGKGSFEPVMATIAKLDQISFPYHIRATVTPERFSCMKEDISFLCDATNCKSIQIEPAFNTIRGSHQKSNTEDNERFADAFLEAWDAAHERNCNLYYSGARPWLVTNVFCEAPFGQSLTVNAKGEVVGCYEMTGRDTNIDDSSLFGSEDALDFRIDNEKRAALMEKIGHRKDRCDQCFCRWHCAGDCYTRGFPTENGEWPYSRCDINRKITSGLIVRGIADQSSL